MADAVDVDQLEDVSNSEAYKILDALLDMGEILPEKADNAKAHFTKLHAALVAAMTNERQLLEEAKNLKKRLEDDQDTQRIAVLAASEESSDSGTIVMLREDVESAQAEAALAQEKHQLLQLEVNDLQRQRNELAARIEELQQEHIDSMKPVIEHVESEISALRVELQTERKRSDNAKRDMELSKQRLDQMLSDVATLQEQSTILKSELVKADLLPEKAKRQSDAVAALLKNVMSQQEQLDDKLKSIDDQLRGQSLRDKELQDELQRASNALERGRVQLETKERHADGIRKDVEMAAIEAEKILADQVDLDLQLKAAAADLKLEQEVLQRKIKEKDLALRQYRTVEADLKASMEALPNLNFQIHQLQRDRSRLSDAVRQHKKAAEEVKRELDISMNEFLKEESLGKEQAAMFALTYQEVGILEDELYQLKQEEQERAKVLLDLGSQRDRMALAIAQKLAKVKEVNLQAQIKEVELAELKKIRREVQRRMAEYEKLYELVKNQRNKFVNLIQGSGQSMTEMKDKLKILSNELEILHSEVNVKERLLAQSRSQHQAACSERDMMRIEMGRLGGTFRSKQTEVDEQIADVDKLNAVLNVAEKDMMRLKKQYEVAIEARNYTGIMLIDRNDELCILYEKSNIQNEVVKAGTLELRRREDEIRMLTIEVHELQRSVEVTKKVLPTIPLLDMDVARLQKSLLEAHREAERLSLALEDPSANSRWRVLEGKVPDKEELVAKLQQLEERLNDKKEQLLEKELILQEVSQLADRLRQQASEGRADTLELAHRVNEYQSKLRDITRKIMATVSELSMYQATALKLAAERDELEVEVVGARERISAGLAPNESAEREWYRMERERLTMAELAAQRHETDRILDTKTAQTQSAAEARPNAYIPESLGIPKPYGTFSPFKPTEVGSTMRHIRKPQPKDIVI